MQISVLSGVYMSSTPDIRVAYPVNMQPVPTENGISGGYLRPHDGIVQQSVDVSGVCRGGIYWPKDGKVYRAMGQKLSTVAADGTIDRVLNGDLLSDSGPVRFDYSFTHLGIASGGNFFLWDGITFTHVDTSLVGYVVDAVWVDGYWFLTNGESTFVTDLNDPTVINPFQGSAEVDPDAIVAVLKVRNEVHVINRSTVEVFDNTGEGLFPFQRIDGAQITRGAVGTRACCVFLDALAFVGGQRGEQPAVWIGANGQSTKLSTVEVERILRTYSEQQLADLFMETRIGEGHQLLYIHLPDRTLVYDAAASQAFERPVWFCLTSSTVGFGPYRGRYFVWAFNRFNVADPLTRRLGYLDREVASHWGELVRWEFSTAIIYNESRGAIVQSLELVAVTGAIPSTVGATQSLSTSYSLDGETWSEDKWINGARVGDRAKRLQWRQQGRLRDRRIQRFRGDSNTRLAVARLEAVVEPLAW
jgi:hypothetical protein